MTRNAKALAKKVAAGTATAREAQDFKATVLILGWEGHVGRGVINHVSGERFRSFKALAASMLENGVAVNGALQAGSEPAPAEAAPEAYEPESAPDPRDESSDGELALVYWYTTRVPTVRLSDLTSVDVVLSEEAHGYVEAECEIRGPECTGHGFLRVDPLSMLPGGERAQRVQCLADYEAAAAEYVTKLHGAS
jgi:hypothetical protein